MDRDEWSASRPCYLIPGDKLPVPIQYNDSRGTLTLHRISQREDKSFYLPGIKPHFLLSKPTELPRLSLQVTLSVITEDANLRAIWRAPNTAALLMCFEVASFTFTNFKTLCRNFARGTTGARVTWCMCHCHLISYVCYYYYYYYYYCC
jgi:hypothetical protein